MKQYQIKIELLSDLCVSDGGVYNSMLDTDVCFDSFGFPYIPAKRIRGCLRECALELSDWGLPINSNKIFGREENDGKDQPVNRTAIRISDAKLCDYEKLLSEVMEHAESIVFHPQNILNHYSYIRTQTSIDMKTGVADDKSLRTMRVVNKGNIFYADVDVYDEHYIEDIQKCCDVLRHMGIARTRGLGEIRCTWEEKEKDVPDTSGMSFTENADFLEYMLTLQEPMICKSVYGEESNTLDYIEGSKIFGLILQKCKENQLDIQEFLNGEELICSNAYLSENGVRLLEVPGTFYSIKNNKTNYVDKSCENEENRKKTSGLQLNAMKHCYVTFDEAHDLIRKQVEIVNRYHHRRPEDKSIGRAVESDGNSNFYQLSSIAPGQSFQGYISGSREQIRKIYDWFTSQKYFYMGYGRSSEYGKVYFDEIKAITAKEKQVVKGKKIAVKLEAPAIIYNEKAFYSTDGKDLKDEICMALHIEPARVIKEKYYLKYTVAGGFNVTWGRRKPTIECFDKGTVIILSLDEEAEIVLSHSNYIGERYKEGFGEISVSALDSRDNYYGLIKDDAKRMDKEKIQLRNQGIGYFICDDLFCSFIRTTAGIQADQFMKDSKFPAAILNPTVSNLVSMVKENATIEAVINDAIQRYDKNTGTKENKKEAAAKIIKEAEEKVKGLIGEFSEKYKVAGYECHVDYELMYLGAFLTEIKYLLRHKKGGQKDE